MIRHILAIAGLLLAASAGQAFGQVPQPPPGAPKEIRLATPIKYGESCKRLSDSQAGVFKRDACGRTYCGLARIKDITELQPDYAERHACAWTLEGTLCKCIRTARK